MTQETIYVQVESVSYHRMNRKTVLLKGIDLSGGQVEIDVSRDFKVEPGQTLVLSLTVHTDAEG